MVVLFYLSNVLALLLNKKICELITICWRQVVEFCENRQKIFYVFDDKENVCRMISLVSFAEIQ